VFFSRRPGRPRGFERGAVDCWVIWIRSSRRRKPHRRATLPDGTASCRTTSSIFSSKEILESGSGIVDLVLAELSAADDWQGRHPCRRQTELGAAIGLPVGVVEVA